MSSARKSAADPAVDRAVDEILGCEHCSDSADTPFYWVVDSLGESTPGAGSAVPPDTRCPRCGAPIAGPTRVDWE